MMHRAGAPSRSRPARAGTGTPAAGPDTTILPGLVRDLAQHDRVLAVILFGSVARNEPKPFSDIDICIVTDRQATREEKAELAGHASPVIEISFFHDLPLIIRHRVLKEGKVLFCRNGPAFRRIATDTVRAWLDFQPVFRRHGEHTLGVPG